MSRFDEASASFPLELDANGEVALAVMVAHTTRNIPSGVILALRLADSPADLDAGGNRTVQIGLNLLQVQRLQASLRTLEMVLGGSEFQRSVQH